MPCALRLTAYKVLITSLINQPVQIWVFNNSMELLAAFSTTIIVSNNLINPTSLETIQGREWWVHLERRNWAEVLGGTDRASGEETSSEKIKEGELLGLKETTLGGLLREGTILWLLHILCKIWGRKKCFRLTEKGPSLLEGLQIVRWSYMKAKSQEKI